jgi:hypothetical protein
MRWLVVLHTMWAPGASGREAPRFFTINRRNCSGRTLYQMFGDIQFVVTDAARLMSSAPDEHQPVDRDWLLSNLLRHKWKGILVCGNEARSTLLLNEWPQALQPIYFMPHPASRSLRNVMKDEVRKLIAAPVNPSGMTEFVWDKDQSVVKVLPLGETQATPPLPSAAGPVCGDLVNH